MRHCGRRHVGTGSIRGNSATQQLRRTGRPRIGSRNIVARHRQQHLPHSTLLVRPHQDHPPPLRARRTSTLGCSTHGNSHHHCSQERRRRAGHRHCSAAAAATFVPHRRQGHHGAGVEWFAVRGPGVLRQRPPAFGSGRGKDRERFRRPARRGAGRVGDGA